MGAAHKKSDAKSKALLGEHLSGARRKLDKIIHFDMLQRSNRDICYRCGRKIEHIEELSVEHKQPWRSAADPKASFFDLTNIAWSHLWCNARAANYDKTHCKRGHPFDESNIIIGAGGGRRCRQCAENYRQSNKEQVKQRSRNHYENNKERINQRIKEYRKNNKEWGRQYSKDYRKKNRERVNQYSRDYYHRGNNKEYLNQRNKEYRQENKERIKDYRQKNKERTTQRAKDYYQKNKERFMVPKCTDGKQHRYKKMPVCQNAGCDFPNPRYKDV